MNRHFASLWRVVLLSGLILSGFSLVAFRLYYLQVLDQLRFEDLAEDVRRDFEVLEARRGSIYDARGTLLATSEERYVIGIDPGVASPGDPRHEKVARVLDLAPGTIETAARQTGRRWVKLREGVREGTYRAVRDVGAPGVYGNRTFKRVYPGGPTAAHLLGFLNDEGVAVGGIEQVADYYLAGQDGWRETERDGRRRELSQYRAREVPARDGTHVALTVDLLVQDVVERVASEVEARMSPLRVSILVTEATTGRILALTNRPSFDPNDFAKFPINQHRNRAVVDPYEPGSVIKIVTVAAALEEALVTPATLVDCASPVAEYRNRVVRLPEDSSPHGDLSVEEVLVKSSNRGAAQLGMLLGEHRLHDWMERFGFGEETSLGLPGEHPGKVKAVSTWDGLTVAQMPMGHALYATSLQVHMAMATIANDGVLMEPRLIDQIFHENGDTLAAFFPEARRRVVSSGVARTVARMLAKVPTPDGTAREAAIPGYAIAGKTGTAQKVVNGMYSRRHHIASFAGFLPVEDPQFVISVVVDDPQTAGVGYGGRIAAPAFREIAQSLIQIYRLPPTTQPHRGPLASHP